MNTVHVCVNFMCFYVISSILKRPTPNRTDGRVFEFVSNRTDVVEVGDRAPIGEDAPSALRAALDQVSGQRAHREPIEGARAR